MSFQQCYSNTGDAKACCSRIAAAACKISSGPTVTHKDGIGCEYTSSSSSALSCSQPFSLSETAAAAASDCVTAKHK